jgi:hypothetical protein
MWMSFTPMWIQSHKDETIKPGLFNTLTSLCDCIHIGVNEIWIRVNIKTHGWMPFTYGWMWVTVIHPYVNMINGFVCVVCFRIHMIIHLVSPYQISPMRVILYNGFWGSNLGYFHLCMYLHIGERKSPICDVYSQTCELIWHICGYWLLIGEYCLPMMCFHICGKCIHIGVNGIHLYVNHIHISVFLRDYMWNSLVCVWLTCMWSRLCDFWDSVFRGTNHIGVNLIHMDVNPICISVNLIHISVNLIFSHICE